MRSTDFRSIVEPILNECFDGVYDQRTDEWSRVFRESQGIPRNYHEEPVLYGFGAAPQLPDGTPVSYQQGGVLFLKRYVYNVYGLAFALTTSASVRCTLGTSPSRSLRRRRRCRPTC
jgi:peptidoglycan hydrolase-like protein with peptidoglycan-binding domain